MIVVSQIIHERVSAGDLVRNFPDIQEKCRDRPLVITRHGKPTHALMTYEQLQAISRSAAYAPDEVDRCKITMFDDIGVGAFILSDTLHVLAANSAACGMIRRDFKEILGVSFCSIFPEPDNALLQRYVRRTAASGEPLTADAPLGRDGRWVHLSTYRSGPGVTVTLRDTTDDSTARHCHDVNRALVAAICHDPRVGYARISVREVVEHVSESLVAMVGIAEDAFRRVKFSSAMPTSDRIAFNTALERAFAGLGPQSLNAALVDRHGQEIPVRITLVDLRGDYSSEGAIVFVSAGPSR